MKIYTKTGDDGTTSLIGGKRVKKYDIRLEAYGTVDELNSWIGLIIATIPDSRASEVLLEIQNVLFDIGAQLATESETIQNTCTDADIKILEDEIDYISDMLPPLKNFVLPGGCVNASYAHLARTVCRRTERRILELADQKNVNLNLIKYINRLSDYLFVLSRWINKEQNFQENTWVKNKKNNIG